MASRELLKDGRPVDGYEVYHWPEFLALCERLGIVWEKAGTTAIEIRVAIGEPVAVLQEYQAREPQDTYDTTSLPNETARTSAPTSKPPEDMYGD